MNQKNIFLLDGLGGVLTAILVGGVLPAIHETIGMPVGILYGLALWGAVSAGYSLSFFWLVDHQNTRWLKVIMVTNSLYSLLTAVLEIAQWNTMKPWGIAYFAAEIVVLLSLVSWQRRIVVSAA